MNRSDAARELGLPPNAPAVHVERAFRTAARRSHPDLGGDADSFRRAAEARAVLLRPSPTDPVTRVVEMIVRYHPAIWLVEAVVRAVDRRAPQR